MRRTRLGRKRSAGWLLCKARQPAEGCRPTAAVIARRSVSWFAVWHCRAAPTLPTDLDPAIQFVQINMAGQHQQARRNEFLASPCGACEPATRDRPGAFRTKVVAALSDLSEVINQGLEFGSFQRRAGLRRGARRTDRWRTCPNSVGTRPTQARAICESSTARPTQKTGMK